MSFSRHTEYQMQLERLIALAKRPGTRAYAWVRSTELDAEESGLYRGIAAALTDAMGGPAWRPVSEARKLMKPP